MKKERNLIHIDILRIIACVFVIFNHTGAIGFTKYLSYPIYSVHYWCWLFVSVLCKTAVPLFLMISGALLLNKEEISLYDLWFKKIARMVAVLFVFSFMHYFVKVIAGEEIFSIKSFLYVVYDRGWDVSYWYIYAYIAMLITLPFLHRMVSNMNQREFMYLIVLGLIMCGILPCIQQLLWDYNHNLNINIGWLLNSTVIFPCIGFQLQHRIQERIMNRSVVVKLLCVSFISILISCAMITISGQDRTDSFMGAFLIIQCITIYVTVKYIVNKMDVAEKIVRAITILGKSTFGIYLVHMVVMRFYNKFLTNKFGLDGVSACLCMIAVVFSVSLLITLVISRIPGIKRCI